ncbi:MAG: indole-3-glycerol phosphate synthase TrpC [Proteobacteria bacterium]|nr:indole-3-glycerol phosphate synthase TrpC [Pseudomonadota bacterium]
MGKDFLKIIVSNKHEEVAASKKKMPEGELRRNAYAIEGKRPFLENLKRFYGASTVNIIAEIKRASPSKGDIHPELDPSSLAREYEKGGASALSVLTDEKFFKGSFNDFLMARKASTLPMLRKDFLVDEYQVYESRVLGADAILLIARILEKEQLKEYLALSSELSMDALVEIHSEDDLEKANDAHAKLIGINNRNLSSFDTDIHTAMRFSSMLSTEQIAVAASGISMKSDITASQKAGIYNFLIGESLVRAKDTAAFLKQLRGEEP